MSGLNKGVWKMELKRVSGMWAWCRYRNVLYSPQYRKGGTGEMLCRRKYPGGSEVKKRLKDWEKKTPKKSALCI